MNFTGFDGNGELKLRLSRLFEKGRIPHAIILEGEKGSGKRNLARIIANSLVCTGEDRPCGVCAECIRVQTENHPDISFIKGSGKTGAIPIDEIRRIKNDAYIKPSQAQSKVYILLDADKTQAPAQNAFLKCFEEPPAQAVFIITCESSFSLLETIRSRAVIFRVLNASGESFSQGQNIKNRECAEALALGVISPKELDIMLAAAPLEKSRDTAQEVLDILSIIFRDALAVKCGSDNYISESIQAAQKLSKKLSIKQLTALYDICRELIFDSGRFVNQPLMTAKISMSLRKIAND